ncbi:hypothetical protein PQO03_02680 [Lentisphaera profundi]|uniref:Uncharacterized protein n=1 Tax=Lentisphaera profundi TaxID=1658616 RepID=A0ABY7VVL9_9BACT|nr:hypothetical protein [Lentisphaera profundi]WDE96866.1 hypothetical protein PQO03_02680 [Lentisphaera profundi]
MPKNLKVLLLVVLAVNAMNDIDADFVHGELQLSPKTSYRLMKEGVLRIEKQQQGNRLRAILVTKDKQSNLNGLRFNILEKKQGLTDFYQDLQKDATVLLNEAGSLNNHYQAPQLSPMTMGFIQTSQLVLYDDEEASLSTICA